MPVLNVRQVIKILEADGWYEEAKRGGGSHRQFRHPAKPGTVTVAGKLSSDIDRGTLRSIFRQASLPWPPR